MFSENGLLIRLIEKEMAQIKILKIKKEHICSQSRGTKNLKIA
jgi:hypothetical protein